MAAQVVVAPVGDALELVPAPREQELHIGGGRRVVAQLVGPVGPQPYRLGVDAQVQVPLVPGLAPVLEPVAGRVGRDEVLHLHLLELAGAEHEVPRRDLVAERLADLGDSEGRPLAAGPQYVGEVDEHALGGLGPQVDRRRGVGHRPGMSGEHQVELPRLGELTPFPAVGAGLGVLQLVGAVAGAARAAVHHRIGEVVEVPRGLPHRRRRQDRGVQADHVVAHLHHRPPPLLLDVAQQQHPERSVVVGGAKTAVDLRRAEHEAAPHAEVDDRVEQFRVGRRLGHGRQG